MSALACFVLRHDLRRRWVGDLLCAWCETCRCLWVPEPTAAPKSAPEFNPADWAPGELVAAWGK